MSTTHVDHRTASPSVSGSHIWNTLRSVFGLVSLWSERAANRRQLRELLRADERILSDIGLSRDEVMREAFKTFWRE